MAPVKGGGLAGVGASAADALGGWRRGGDDATGRIRLADTLVAYHATAGVSFPRGLGWNQQTAAWSGLSWEARARRLAGRARYSEIDDIMLPSCLTAGAIAAPAVLAVAGACPERGADAVLGGLAAAYAVADLYGMALGGTRALQRGVWPSRAVAALSAAGGASVLLGLDADTCSHALALAGACAWDGRAPEPAREIQFASAVGAGVASAMLAADGVRGDLRLLEEWPPPAAETPPAPGSRPAPALRRRAIDTARLKPLCCARQALPAVLAFSSLIAAEDFAVARLERLTVLVPEPLRGFVDRPGPRTRLESIASVQYQLAAAAWDPGVLWDVRREELALAAECRSLGARTVVAGDAALAADFPRRWPARVLAELDDGAVLSRCESDVPGASGSDREALARKIARVHRDDASERRRAQQLAALCLRFSTAGELADQFAAWEEAPAT